MIYIIEDAALMAEGIAEACKGYDTKIFADAITAMNAVAENVPDLIFLDILLTGPDGFTFLNELISYTDTAKIPIVIISSLDFKGQDLSIYGVVGTLNKSTMLPEDIHRFAEKYSKGPKNNAKRYSH